MIITITTTVASVYSKDMKRVMAGDKQQHHLGGSDTLARTQPRRLHCTSAWSFLSNFTRHRFLVTPDFIGSDAFVEEVDLAGVMGEWG